MDLTIRRIPKTHWVRIGVGMDGKTEPSWKPHRMYRGIVTRIAWTVLGCGPYVIVCWKTRCRPKTAKWLWNEPHVGVHDVR